MDYYKIAYKAKKFVQQYESQLEKQLLYSVKRDFNPAKEESYYNSIKHLYLLLSVKCGLPEWYQELVQYRHRDMEDYFLALCQRKIEEACFSDRTDEFINKKLLKHYRGKGSFYLAPVMGSLPLHLRLKVYVHLYEEEEDLILQCYLRHRMAALLAKLNEVKAAQRLSIYNWALAKATDDPYFCDIDYLKQTLKAHKSYAYEIAHWHVNHDASLLGQELIIYYKTLLEEEDGYTATNTATLELVALSYNHYEALGALTYAIKSFLRTKDREAFRKQLEEQKRKFIYTHEEKIWLDQELKDQLIIYKELLKG